MLYNLVILTLIVVAVVGAFWAGDMISKAAKEGKLRVMGIVTKDTRIDDDDRMAWLDASPLHLLDAYWRMQNENCSMREALDFFIMRNDD